MEINTPEKEPRVVADWEFVSHAGLPVTVTVDETDGDWVIWDPTSTIVQFHITEKKSPLDPDIVFPARDFTVFLAQVFTSQVAYRKVTEVTPEQRDEWKSAMKAFTRPSTL